MWYVEEGDGSVRCLVGDCCVWYVEEGDGRVLHVIGDSCVRCMVVEGDGCMCCTIHTEGDVRVHAVEGLVVDGIER